MAPKLCTLFSLQDWLVAWFCLGGTVPQLWIPGYLNNTTASVGADVTHEQSSNAEILLKDHLVDFIIVCHVDALLIRVQQVLLTTRIRNKGSP